MHKAQRLINHIAMVLDGSSSMYNHTKKLIEVTDEQIRHLALRSEEMNQETRVSVYLFSDTVECLIFDMDVMRLPSISDLYKAHGMTALIDAVVKSQQDLSTTSQIYGDHAFLTYVLTDGAENRSRNGTAHMIAALSDSVYNRSVAFLVPDRSGEAYLTRLGVSRDNIAIWDATNTTGLIDAGNTIKVATDRYMTNRASGLSTRSVFSTGVDAVNTTTVNSTLTRLDPHSYRLLDVPDKVRIDDFINGKGFHYRVGSGYYQLSKTETIQPQKQIMVLDKATGYVFSGREARHLIGLPDGMSVRVKPDYNPKYDIFVQSTSVNRNLMPNTKVLYYVN